MAPIPVRLTQELLARIDRLAKEMSISRSAVMRLAIRQWLEAVESRCLNPLVGAESAVLRRGRPPAAKVGR